MLVTISHHLPYLTAYLSLYHLLLTNYRATYLSPAVPFSSDVARQPLDFSEGAAFYDFDFIIHTRVIDASFLDNDCQFLNVFYGDVAFPST